MNLSNILTREELIHWQIPTGNFALIALPSSDIHRQILLFTGDGMGETLFVQEAFDKSHSKTFVEVTEAEHADMIGAALEAIEQGALEKVVISRAKKIAYKHDEHARINAFTKLYREYPMACVNWFRINGKEWMGATPEMLVQQEGTQWSTMSLAGTQPLRSGVLIEHHGWTDKEIHEQQIVTQFIENQLQAIGAEHIETSEAFNSKAGNLVHIRTNIRFQFDGGYEEVVRALHPTPAVCGFPREAAYEFIRTTEPHDRGKYSGYFGVQNAQGQVSLYVNLRCIQWVEDGVILYAGGGIVAGSDAQKEWEETERKMNVVWSVIKPG